MHKGYFFHGELLIAVPDLAPLVESIRIRSHDLEPFAEARVGTLGISFEITRDEGLKVDKDKQAIRLFKRPI